MDRVYRSLQPPITAHRSFQSPISIQGSVAVAKPLNPAPRLPRSCRLKHIAAQPFACSSLIAEDSELPMVIPSSTDCCSTEIWKMQHSERKPSLFLKMAVFTSPGAGKQWSRTLASKGGVSGGALGPLACARRVWDCLGIALGSFWGASGVLGGSFWGPRRGDGDAH